jgi:hypothetical protein
MAVGGPSPANANACYAQTFQSKAQFNASGSSAGSVYPVDIGTVLPVMMSNIL